MHTSPTHDDKGHVTGFEISNLLISKGGVVKLLRTIPTMTINKCPKRWALDDDDFVHFTINEHLQGYRATWGQFSLLDRR
jgi:hypothetical protein